MREPYIHQIMVIYEDLKKQASTSMLSLQNKVSSLIGIGNEPHFGYTLGDLQREPNQWDSQEGRDLWSECREKIRQWNTLSKKDNLHSDKDHQSIVKGHGETSKWTIRNILPKSSSFPSEYSTMEIEGASASQHYHDEALEFSSPVLDEEPFELQTNIQPLDDALTHSSTHVTHVCDLKNTSIKPSSSKTFSHFLGDKFTDTTSTLPKRIHDRDNTLSLTLEEAPLPSLDIKSKLWPSLQSIELSSELPSTKNIPELESPLEIKPIIDVKLKSLQSTLPIGKGEFPLSLPQSHSKEVSLPAPSAATDELSHTQPIHFGPEKANDTLLDNGNLKSLSPILSAIDSLPSPSCKLENNPSQALSTTAIWSGSTTKSSNHVNSKFVESHAQRNLSPIPFGTSKIEQGQTFINSSNSSSLVEPKHLFDIKHESLPGLSSPPTIDTSPILSSNLPQPSSASIPAHTSSDTKCTSLLPILSSGVVSSIASIPSLQTPVLSESNEEKPICVLSHLSAIDLVVIPSIKPTIVPQFNNNDLSQKSHLSCTDVKSDLFSDSLAPTSATNLKSKTLNSCSIPYVDGSSIVQSDTELRSSYLMFNQPQAFFQGNISLESARLLPASSSNKLSQTLPCIHASKLIEKGKAPISSDFDSELIVSHSSSSSDSTNAVNDFKPSFLAHEIPLSSTFGKKISFHTFQNPHVHSSNNPSTLEKLEDNEKHDSSNNNDTTNATCLLHSSFTQRATQQSDNLSSYGFCTKEDLNALPQKSRDVSHIENNPFNEEFSSIPLSDMDYIEREAKTAPPRAPLFSNCVSKTNLPSAREERFSVEVQIPYMPVNDLLSTKESLQPQSISNQTYDQTPYTDICTSGSSLPQNSSRNELPCEQTLHVTFTQDEAISIPPPTHVNIETSDTDLAEPTSQASFHDVLTNFEQSATEALSTILPPLRKKLSIFFGATTPHLPSSLSSSHEEEGSQEPTPPSNDQDDDDDEHAPQGGNFNMQKVKKKMSMFLATRMPSLVASNGTSASEASSFSQLSERAIDDSKFDGSEMPSFYNQAASSSYTEPNFPNEESVTQGRYQKRVPKARKFRGAMQNQHQVHLLTNFQLIAITFFAVSGGPYGFESTVGAGGPGLMLVGLLFFPVLWAAPLAYMTAELSCMIPESGGHVLWVYRAFGPFWSFVNSCFAFACSVLDNAMYPVLFVEYISALFYEDNDSIPYGWSVFFKVLIVFIVTIINILGVDIVGFASVTLGLMMLAPLATMCLLGLFRLNFDWMDSTSSGSGGGPAVIDWQKFVTLLLWNTSGFDAAGTCAAEVHNPSQSYPHALKISVALIVAVYAVPTIIGVSVIPNNAQWTEGTYVIVSKLIGGNLLKSWMGLSAASSALGLLLTRLCFNSRIVYGMALVEQVPPVFAKIHPTYATPWVAILATSLCTLLLTGFNFYSIAEADMLFYACSTILKFAALVQLRFTEPDAFRPYRIPIENIPLAVCAIVPIALCILIIWLSSEHAHGIVLAGASGAILLFSIKEFFTQYGDEAEEAVNHRMSRMQENLNKMQRRIDKVISEEFSAPLSNLGDAIRFSNRQIRSGLQRHMLSRPTVEYSDAEREAGRIS